MITLLVLSSLVGIISFVGLVWNDNRTRLNKRSKRDYRHVLGLLYLLSWSIAIYLLV